MDIIVSIMDLGMDNVTSVELSSLDIISLVLEEQHANVLKVLNVVKVEIVPLVL